MKKQPRITCGLAARLAAAVLAFNLVSVAALFILVSSQMRSMREVLEKAGVHQSDEYLVSVHSSLLWAGPGLCVLSFVLAFAAFSRLSKPLKALAEAAAEIAQGRMPPPLRQSGAGEIGVLARAFESMRRKLCENDQSRRLLFAGIAHELRTPLSVLRGNLEGMADGVFETSQQRIVSMEDEVLRLTRLVEDLRDLSLAEVHRLTLHRRPTDLRALISGVISLMRPLAEDRGLALEDESGVPELTVNADPDRLRQVLINLISNAVRYADTGAVRVRASSGDPGRGAVITVSDEGPGIAPEDRRRIFECFWRGGDGESRGGTGIGLALSREYVRAHGGEITLEEGEKRGCVFTVVLPDCAGSCAKADRSKSAL